MLGAFTMLYTVLNPDARRRCVNESQTPQVAPGDISGRAFTTTIKPGKTIGKPWENVGLMGFNGGFMVVLWWFYGGLMGFSLWHLHTMKRSTMLFMGKLTSFRLGHVQLAMSNYQRVNPMKSHKTIIKPL